MTPKQMRSMDGSEHATSLDYLRRMFEYESLRSVTMCKMMKYALGVIGLFFVTATSNAQLVLLGCTGANSLSSPTSKLVDLNSSTGQATNIRDTGIFGLGGIAWQHATGTLFGLSSDFSIPSNALMTINMQTGTPALVGTTGLSAIIEGDIAFDPLTGNLFGVQDLGSTFNQRNLFRIDVNTGLGTTVGSLDPTGDYSGLAFSPTGTLYSINSAGNGASVLNSLNPNNGAIIQSLTMNVNLGDGVGLAINPLTGDAFVSDGGFGGIDMLYHLNLASGNLLPIGPTGVSEGVSALTFVVVPEPSSAALLGISVIGLGICGRLKRKRLSASL